MMEAKSTRREVTLPAPAIVELLDHARGAGDAGLRARGRTTGRILGERLLSPQDRAGSARALPVDTFWKRVGELFSSRGWGTLSRVSDGEPGLGELRSGDWIEADRSGGGSCAFTMGVLEGLLAWVASAPIAVEEVECRARGGSACRFAFGSPSALSVRQDTGTPNGV